MRDIFRDNKKRIWLGTNEGLRLFDPIKNSSKNYKHIDQDNTSLNDDLVIKIAEGLQGNSFKALAWYKTHECEMLYGGINGFNIFHPDSVSGNPLIPNIVITKFLIFNKPVGIGNDSPLKTSISEAKGIIISYKQSVFTFEFASLNYWLPEKNEYSYMLEGFENEWNYIGGKHSATYTNLDVGEYTFKVRGSNNDGI